MRQSPQQVRLRLNPAQNLLVGDQKLDVPAGPQVADAGAAQVAEEAHVGDEDAGDQDEDEGGGPGGDLVGADTRYVSEDLTCWRSRGM